MRKIRAFFFFVSLFIAFVAGLVALTYKNAADYQKSCADLDLQCEPGLVDQKIEVLRQKLVRAFKR